MEKVCEIKANAPSVSLFETIASNQPYICNCHQTVKQWDKRRTLWRIEINV